MHANQPHRAEKSADFISEKKIRHLYPRAASSADLYLRAAIKTRSPLSQLGKVGRSGPQSNKSVALSPRAETSADLYPGAANKSSSPLPQRGKICKPISQTSASFAFILKQKSQQNYTSEQVTKPSSVSEQRGPQLRTQREKNRWIDS